MDIVLLRGDLVFARCAAIGGFLVRMDIFMITLCAVGATGGRPYRWDPLR
jgi:hypothetical protein